MSSVEPKHTADCRVDSDGVTWTCASDCQVPYPQCKSPPRPGEKRRVEVAATCQRIAANEFAEIAISNQDRRDLRAAAEYSLETPAIDSRPAERESKRGDYWCRLFIDEEASHAVTLQTGAEECERLRAEAAKNYEYWQRAHFGGIAAIERAEAAEKELATERHNRSMEMFERSRHAAGLIDQRDHAIERAEAAENEVQEQRAALAAERKLHAKNVNVAAEEDAEQARKIDALEKQLATARKKT